MKSLLVCVGPTGKTPIPQKRHLKNVTLFVAKPSQSEWEKRVHPVSERRPLGVGAFHCTHLLCVSSQRCSLFPLGRSVVRRLHACCGTLLMTACSAQPCADISRMFSCSVHILYHQTCLRMLMACVTCRFGRDPTSTANLSDSRRRRTAAPPDRVVNVDNTSKV